MKTIRQSPLHFSAALRCALALSMLTPVTSWSQAETAPFPSQPITIVVGFPPAGGMDTVARLVADKLAPMLRQPVIVENRPGASSGVAARHVAAAKPDGHTIFVTSNSMLAHQLSSSAPGYDAERDLATIGKYVIQANLLVASNELPANTLAEVVALSKRQDLTYASPGLGSITHLAAEYLLTVLAGASVRHVPYAGAAPALSNVMGNHVPLGIVSAPSAVSAIQAGRLKGIVVTSSRRMPTLPNVATAIEAGYKDFVVETWGGFFAPAATPRHIIEALDVSIARTIVHPDVKKKLESMGYELTHLNPAEFREEIASEMRRWKHLLTKVSLK